MDAKNVLFLAYCSIALGAAISYASSELAPAYIAANTAMSACAAAIIYLLYSISSSRRASALRAADFMNAIGRISYYLDSGVPTASAMEKAAKSCTDPRAASMLKSAALRVQLGERLSDAMGSASLSDCRIRMIVAQHVRGGGFDFGGAFSAYGSQRSERDAANGSSMSRYSTANMFISTVAPSFVIFSFIGSMLISQAGTSIAMMAFSLVIALPIVYAISSSSLSRRLFG